MRTLNMKLFKKALLKITLSLSHITLGGRPGYYYGNLLFALITEQPILLKETLILGGTTTFSHLLFSSKYQLCQGKEGRVVQDGGNCV